MNFKLKDIIFLIVLIYKLNIVCAKIQTLQTLPHEIIQKILIFNDFDLDDYHSKIPIANTLNKNNFFQDSPCQIIAYLFNIAKPNLMLTCKQFDNYIKRNIKNEIPSQHQLYINFLIENQLIFNFNKERVLTNLALLLFNVYDKKINSSYKNDLEFYEPLAFALTFKKYNRSHLVENSYKIQGFENFFNNVLWFNKNLSFYYLSEPEKLVLIHYLSYYLGIKFYQHHQLFFKKILKNKKRTKDFLDVIQYSIEKRDCNKFIEILFYNDNQYIEPNKNTIQIIKFFTLNNIHLNDYEYKDYMDSQKNEYKNTLRIIELFYCYKSDCNNCCKNKKSLIAFILKKNFYNKTSFLSYIIKFLIKQENNCNHTTFENQNIKNWIQKTFPKTDTDYKKFINIVSFLKNTSFIDLLSSWQYTDLLDKNSNVFKNMAKLTDFCQKHNHLLKAITDFKQNPGQWRNNYYLPYGFEDFVLLQIKCYCYNCTKSRLYSYYILLPIVFLLITGSSIFIFVFFVIDFLKSLKIE